MIDVKYVATIFFVSALHIPLSAHAESSLLANGPCLAQDEGHLMGPPLRCEAKEDRPRAEEKIQINEEPYSDIGW